MDKLKQWIALTVVACLGIAAAGWFLLISPKRSEAADLRAQAQEQRAANDKLQSELRVLRVQAKELPTKQAELALVSAKIPDNPALPGLVRALLEAAGGSGVELVSVAPADPVLVEQPAPAAPKAGDAQQGPDAKPAAGTAAAAPGPAGRLASIPLSINVVGDYFEVQQFLAAVEDMTRALRVEGLTIAPGLSPTAPKEQAGDAEDGRSVTATINGYVYMAADRPAPVAATVPGADGAPADTADDGK